MTRAQLRARLLSAPIGEPIAIHAPDSAPPCASVLATRWEDGWSVVRLHGDQRLPSAPDLHGSLDRVAPVIAVWLGLPGETTTAQVMELHQRGATVAEIVEATGAAEVTVRAVLSRAKLRANKVRRLVLSVPQSQYAMMQDAAGAEGVSAWAVARLVDAVGGDQ